MDTFLTHPVQDLLSEKSRKILNQLKRQLTSKPILVNLVKGQNTLSILFADQWGVSYQPASLFRVMTEHVHMRIDVQGRDNQYRNWTGSLRRRQK